MGVRHSVTHYSLTFNVGKKSRVGEGAVYIKSNGVNFFRPGGRAASHRKTIIVATTKKDGKNRLTNR